jgi:fructose-1,6-bisphosphatase/inositol monophosphatase family enzyme
MVPKINTEIPGVDDDVTLSDPALTDAELAGALVTSAGRLAARMLQDGLTVDRKTSISDVVSDADKAAEAMIVGRLAAARPDDGVIGEEGAAAPGRRTWVIDPVDGTYNFHHGLSWWCSAIALEDADDVLLGAVFHPHDDELFVGGPDLPSTRNGQPLERLVDIPLGQTCATTYLHPPFPDPAVSAAWTRAAGGAATLRMLGSGTMDAMAIAQGQLGVSFQHSVSDWDRLPGAAIIRGVGGAARRLDAGGVTWSVAGAVTAVSQVCAALLDG